MGDNFSLLNLKSGLFSPFLLFLPHPSSLFLSLSLCLFSFPPLYLVLLVNVILSKAGSRVQTELYFAEEKGLQTCLPEPGWTEYMES